MRYVEIFNIINFLVEEGYIVIKDKYMCFSKNELVYKLTDQIVDNLYPKQAFDKDDYTINLLRDIRRLLCSLDE